MESYDFIDTIKAEKANAIARYKHFTNITKFFQFIELFIAIAFISWSSTRLPLLFKFTTNFFFSFSSYLTNQHFIFLLGNIIVIICYFLSHRTDSSLTESVNSGIQYSNVPELLPEIQIPVIKTVTPTETVIKKAAKQIKKFQRTQSEKLKSEICVKARKELRRSVTEKKKEKSVERLSNEEFRIAIEAFISKQQTFLKQQSIMVQDE